MEHLGVKKLDAMYFFGATGTLWDIQYRCSNEDV
jgi:hypothetical protein